ncbi:TPA: hypothetical protein ACGU7E_003219 [Vibrio vulnificus]|uniref:hypothetical protein n=2 Tax=Vibrio vulnificus TaxID=672 RepID=UPI000505931C|nr:hypothetical protein [Vibrio vulnificus]EHY1015759.1 hypothetical protein [Vibrio vulnificus]EHY1123036.1 hypothetical protein [Vibrio vulnificus]EIO3980489.1 hypothetical protein [Vibrio vulnificus]EKY4883145.1 hypothetical protein [Vibrio vulnificus]ELY1392746.1 hypothetical protein [Vibrio vulnificus]
MDEETEEAMTPMVDALTGATSAVLLISIFLMISTLTGVSDALKEYGNNALYKNEQILNDVLNRSEPIFAKENNEISFYKAYKLSKEQINFLKDSFSRKKPTKIIITSNDSDNVLTYNMLLFIKDVGLEASIDEIEISYKKSLKSDGFTYLSWEFE